MSGVIHTINAVHGMLERMGIGDRRRGRRPHLVGRRVRRRHGVAAGRRRGWHFAQVLVPGIAWYRERYVLHFEQTVIEMQFPAPYLNNQQTDLWVRRSQGLRLDTTHVQAGYDEAFVRELEGFHAAVTGAEPVRNTVEQAMRDARLLSAVARCAIGADGLTDHLHSAQRARCARPAQLGPGRDRRGGDRSPRLAAGGAREARAGARSPPASRG